MSSLTKAGAYSLKAFKIYKLEDDSKDPIDLKGKIAGFTVNESMGSTYIYGSATVYDTANTIENYPISGEEVLEITYVDFFGDERTEKMFVYSVTNHKLAKEGNDQLIQYTLNYCSLDKFYTDTVTVEKSYTGTTSEIAEIIFEEFYRAAGAEKPFEAEESDNLQTLVIPSYRPDEAMNFLSKRSVSTESYSSFYRFFETREGFFFTTPEYHVRKSEQSNTPPVKYIYDMQADSTPEGQIQHMNSIIEVDFGTRVDTMSDLKSGGYHRNVVELDILNRTPIYREYNHHDAIDSIHAPGGRKKIKLAHEESFSNKHLTDGPTIYVIKDYPSEGMNTGVGNSLRKNTSYAETYTRKVAYAYHYMQNSISVKIYGRTKGVKPGDIIELDLYKFQFQVGQTQSNIERSGKYIVESVQNIFDKDEYYQTLTVTKGALGA